LGFSSPFDAGKPQIVFVKASRRLAFTKTIFKMKIAETSEPAENLKLEVACHPTSNFGLSCLNRLGGCYIYCRDGVMHD
jgi:hypothetical protein